MDLFEIIGPIMIGPSSSHTAGAARIGLIARKLLGEEPIFAEIGFHGSFSKTYRGHGTDRALIGGLLGMQVDDERLRDSLSIAKEKGLVFSFSPVVLRDAHPNSVALTLKGRSGSKVSVVASSIGGGRIEVKMIEGLETSFNGESPTLIAKHIDSPGVIGSVCNVFGEKGINIGRMRDFRKEVGGEAVMVLELDEVPDRSIIGELLKIKNILNVVIIDAL